MYLRDRDLEKTMDIYFTAWKKGLKSTYYLHMKPRHTAEQSTVEVNESAGLGKTGFASAFKSKETRPPEPLLSRGETIAKSLGEVGSPPTEKIIDGKAYKVHGPSDPQEQYICDSCQ